MNRPKRAANYLFFLTRPFCNEQTKPSSFLVTTNSQYAHTTIVGPISLLAPARAAQLCRSLRVEILQASNCMTNVIPLEMTGSRMWPLLHKLRDVWLWENGGRQSELKLCFVCTCWLANRLLSLKSWLLCRPMQNRKDRSLVIRVRQSNYIASVSSSTKAICWAWLNLVCFRILPDHNSWRQ